MIFLIDNTVVIAADVVYFNKVPQLARFIRCTIKLHCDSASAKHFFQKPARRCWRRFGNTVRFVGSARRSGPTRRTCDPAAARSRSSTSTRPRSTSVVENSPITTGFRAVKPNSTNGSYILLVLYRSALQLFKGTAQWFFFFISVTVQCPAGFTSPGILSFRLYCFRKAARDLHVYTGIVYYYQRGKNYIVQLRRIRV